MNKKIISVFFGMSLLFLPFAVLAFNPGAVPGGVLFNINNFIDTIFGLVWTIFAALAVLMLIIGGIEFLTAQGDPGKVKTARQSFIWAVVGIILGIIAFSIPFIIRQALNL